MDIFYIELVKYLILNIFQLYIKINEKEKITGFEIETIGYGSMNLQTVNEIMYGYSIAINTVIDLEKIYL